MTVELLLLLVVVVVLATSSSKDVSLLVYDNTCNAS